ncbi:MAG: insulinase family protein [Ignavibacteriales bacterium]|nr:insulinase family protein [Ignavibacteriales bacterium]
MKNFNTTELPNGTRIISENLRYLKSFSLGFWFNVGSRDEDDTNNGICHFIEHILFKGTKTRQARDISNEIESFGGEINAFTEKDQTCIYSRGYKTNLESTFAVMADMLQNSMFNENDIKNEASVIFDEIKDYEDNPSVIIYDKFEELLFNNNPLRLSILGKRKVVKNLNRADLLKFFNKKYCSNNFIVSACGAIEHNELVALTNKYIYRDFNISNGRKKVYNNYIPKTSIKNRNSNQSYIVIGCPTYGITNKKRWEIILLSNILGEGCGSRLFQILREEMGLAYQVNSSINFFSEISAFGIYLSTHPKKVERCLDVINKELAKIRSVKVSPDELKRAKEYYIGSLLLSLENPTNRMTQAAQSLLYFDRIEQTKEIIRNIESVNQGNIIDAADHFLNELNLTKVIFCSNKK